MTTHESPAGACPACGASNPRDAMFCMRCGHRLAAGEPATTGPTLRFVSVLFGDIIGSTELAARLPTEVWAGTLDRYFRVVRAAVEDRRGRVEKFIGDAVVAVFGAEATREDDAIRAVETAVDACQRIGRLADGLRQSRGIEFAARFAVASGTVAVTDRSSSFAVGEVLNRAARLQQHGHADGVVIDLETWLLVRGSISAAPIGPIAAKGFARPLRAFLVADDGTEGAPRTPFVNQTALLDAAVAAVRGATDGVRASVLIVEGDLGVGKTRILRELARRVSGFAQVVLTTSQSDAGRLGYWPLYQLATDIAELSGEREDSLSRAGSTTGDELSLSQSKEEIFWALRRTLAVAATASPVVLMLDDSQWLSPVVVEFIDDLAASPPARGIAIVICGRRPPRISAAATRLTVAPLGPGETRDLMDAICGDVELHTAGYDLAERSGGNPLFLEQLIHLALDHDGDLIAPSAEAAVGARLDLLSAPARRTLGVAAVIGTTLQVTDLDSIGRDLGVPVAEVLPEILEAALLHSGSDRNGSLAFASSVVAEVAYRRLPLADQARAHMLTARKIQENLSARPSAVELAALHAERAHAAAREIDPGSLIERECAELVTRLICEAGHFAVSRRDLPRGAELAAQASALAGQSPRLRLEAAALEGYIEGSSGRARDALRTSEQALAGIAPEENPSAAAHLLLNAVVAEATLTGRWPHDGLDEARRLADLAADPGARARVLLVQGIRLMSSGDYPAAEPLLRQAMEHVRRDRYRFGAAEIFGNISLCTAYGDTPAAEAAESCRRLLSRPDLEGAHAVRAAISCPTAIAIDMTGDAAGADEFLEEAAATFAAIGHRPGSAGVEEFRATLAQRRGETALAVMALERAAAQYATIGFTTSAASTRLRSVILRPGTVALNGEWGYRADDLPDDWTGRILLCQAEALTAAERGHGDEASRWLRAALDEIGHVRGIGARIVPLLACLRIAGKVGHGALLEHVRRELEAAATIKQDVQVSAALGR